MIQLIFVGQQYLPLLDNFVEKLVKLQVYTNLNASLETVFIKLVLIIVLHFNLHYRVN